MPTPPTRSVELRPLALGEIVDRTATFWRANLGPLFRLFLGYQLYVYALTRGFGFLASRYFPALRRGGQAMVDGFGTPGFTRQLAVGGSAAGVLLLLIWVGTWQIGVAGSRFAVNRLLGQPASLEESLRRAFGKLGATAGAFALSLLWALGMGLLCMLPGTLLVMLGVSMKEGLGGVLLAVFGGLGVSLGMLVAMLWYALRFMLTSQVLAMEEVGALGAFRRSGRLTSGKIGEGVMDRVALRATVLYTAIVFVMLSVNLMSGMPALIVQSVFGHIFDPAQANVDAIPQALLIPAELFQVFMQAVFSPLLTVFAAVFYVDMRVRREGLDLELKLAANGPPAEPAA